MRPRLVLFDLDGTLLDHVGAVRRALDTWLPTIRWPGGASHDALVRAWFVAESVHFDAWRRGDVTFAEQRRRRLRDILPLAGRSDVSRCDDAALDSLFAEYVRAYESAWAPFEDALPCVTALRDEGFRLAVLTNGTQLQQRAKLRAIELDHHVERIVTSEELGVAKPDPRAFHDACTAVGVEPSAAVYVGDDPVIDVQGSLAAGLGAVHVARPGAGEPSRAAPNVPSLADLPSLLT